MTFHDFRESSWKLQKSENRPSGGAPCSNTVKTKAIYRFWRPSGPESGKSGKKCDSHPFSPIFMEFTDFHQFSANFMEFHTFWVVSPKIPLPVVFGYVFKAQIVMRNQDSCIPSWWRIPVLRSSEPFCAENLFRRKLIFCKKWWIPRKRWFRAPETPIWPGNL